MNILLDILSNSQKNGLGEYNRRVIMSLLKYVTKNKLSDIRFFVLYQGLSVIAYEDMRPDTMGKEYGLTYIDVNSGSLQCLVDKYKIDKIYTGSIQLLCAYADTDNLTCPFIGTIHDLVEEELSTNHINEYLKFISPVQKVKPKGILDWRAFIRNKFSSIWMAHYVYKLRKKGTSSKNSVTKRSVELLKNNPKSKIIVVSNYTKSSLLYYYSVPEEQIITCYSPERLEAAACSIENQKLKELIDSGKKYYLAVSCNRESKNAVKLSHAFSKYAQLDKDAYFAMVAYPYEDFDRLVRLDFLSDSDLAQAMQHCYALVYPSFFEGFGYPPIEAMRYGKPILASNTTSIPEVLGDAAIYFSPLYESAIHGAMKQLTAENYTSYVQKSLNKYTDVHQKQENDLLTLLRLIIEK